MTPTDAAREREAIVAAALKFGDVVCSVPQPGRHNHVFHAVEKAGFTRRNGPPEQQGFLTSAGRIAEAANQLIPRRADPKAGIQQFHELYSEDVW